MDRLVVCQVCNDGLRQAGVAEEAEEAGGDLYQDLSFKTKLSEY